jgi:large subunit ribosomal protein L21
MKPKKKTRKKRGHRQEITRLMINSISMNGSSIASFSAQKDETPVTDQTAAEASAPEDTPVSEATTAEASAPAETTETASE